MVFYSKDIIVTTLTTHIPLSKINNYLKQKKMIYQKIYFLNELLKNDFKILNPKLVICGVNPHAGENGTIGNEEKQFFRTNQHHSLFQKRPQVSFLASLVTLQTATLT